MIFSIILLYVIGLITCDNNIYNGNRKLQFEGLIENNLNNKQSRNNDRNSNRPRNQRNARIQSNKQLVNEIKLNSDRYNYWWNGPPDSNIFTIADWGAKHNSSAEYAIFTFAIVQGFYDIKSCQSTINQFKLFLGTLRKYYHDDVVIGIESSIVSDEIKQLLISYNTIVYIISSSLCNERNDSHNIFCGQDDERVPATIFRYYFYEKWLLNYSNINSLDTFIMIVDFRDIIFQSNPFIYLIDDKLINKPTNNPIGFKDNFINEPILILFQEFYPNMIIQNCHFNRKIINECYGYDIFKTLSRKVIISSGGIIGNVDALLVWCRYMTMQLQEAPGRQVETRCLSGGIEHGFINYLVYYNKLRSYTRVKIYAQGDGPMNSLGGLRPNTVIANLTGNLTTFWKVLKDGYIYNWNGEISPVVHQLDHYLDELETITYKELSLKSSHLSSRLVNTTDIPWQALKTSRCLWGCSN